MKRFAVFAVSVCGIHRLVNEDNIFINGFYKSDIDQRDIEYLTEFSVDDCFVTAVFDGMGGQKDGEIAALKACCAVRKQIKKNATPDLMINAANDSICKYNDENDSDSGSTCVLLEYRDGRFRSWNVGDSRAYRISNDRILRLSVDHTEKARFDCLGTTASTDAGNRLTQHLGINSDDFMIEPYVSEWIKPDPEDMFLLCSDGLTGSVSENEIAEAVRKEGSMKDKAFSLLKLSVDKGSCDNVSIILVAENQ